MEINTEIFSNKLLRKPNNATVLVYALSKLDEETGKSTFELKDYLKDFRSVFNEVALLGLLDLPFVDNIEFDADGLVEIEYTDELFHKVEDTPIELPEESEETGNVAD